MAGTRAGLLTARYAAKAAPITAIAMVVRSLLGTDVLQGIVGESARRTCCPPPTYTARSTESGCLNDSQVAFRSHRVHHHCPQGRPADHLRAGRTGIPAFYTPAAVGTPATTGGLPWRYRPDGTVTVASPPKETLTFHWWPYVREEAITTDYALLRAWWARRGPSRPPEPSQWCASHDQLVTKPSGCSCPRSPTRES